MIFDELASSSSLCDDAHPSPSGSLLNLTRGRFCVFLRRDEGTDSRISGKVGGTFNVSQKLGVYGEFSGISNEDADNSYGTKIGAKYSF